MIAPPSQEDELASKRAAGCRRLMSAGRRRRESRLTARRVAFLPEAVLPDDRAAISGFLGLGGSSWRRTRNSRRDRPQRCPTQLGASSAANLVAEARCNRDEMAIIAPVASFSARRSRRYLHFPNNMKHDE
ncbi:hypothetical protein NYD60_25015 [Burkholderia thailandensis]|uniref:hypothetical protein n=1 Tax=Burkholderia thailandensis TaxID=57975 RepID=UPI00217CCA5E|nr:hypothetical protein [Burkholderia thailandensis]MCS6503229.1 hypothetical protein [Burkholderia thailandensis]